MTQRSTSGTFDAIDVYNRFNTSLCITTIIYIPAKVSTGNHMRKKLPIHTETDVLTKSGRRCCICFGIKHDDAEKRGQLAHLDGNNENDSLENLAWLCFEHHDQYDSTTRQSKNFTITEVKEYRKLLYEFIEEQRIKLQISTKKVSAKPQETYYLVGKQLKELREELGIATSEFVELIGFHSEKLYIQMESDEQECSETLIKQIAEAIGVIPDWIKHRGWRKCEVESLMFRLPHAETAIDAARHVMEHSNGLVYVTIAVSTPKSDLPLFWQIKNIWAQTRDKFLHVGLCVPIEKFKYKIYDTPLNFSLTDNYKLFTEPLCIFLKALWDELSFDVRGIIISNWKDEEELYEGRVHPEKILTKHYYSHDIDWIQAVLDYDIRPDAVDYNKYGDWINKIRLEFKKREG